ncbi:MAG: inorganic diphosphatase [archaeon]|nr:inorganic diphosphatase [archaeon]
MSNIVDTMAAERVTPEEFVAFIEITKGSKMKYELDEETGLIAVDRILSTSTEYPWNYGLIPRTLALDGDPLDVLVISSVPIIPGALAKCRPIGVMRMVDSGDQDDKILAVLPKDPAYKGYTDIAQLPEHIGKEIQHFFSVYKALEGKKTETGAIEGPEAAKATIAACIEAYKAKQ